MFTVSVYKNYRNVGFSSFLLSIQYQYNIQYVSLDRLYALFVTLYFLQRRQHNSKL